MSYTSWPCCCSQLTKSLISSSCFFCSSLTLGTNEYVTPGSILYSPSSLSSTLNSSRFLPILALSMCFFSISCCFWSSSSSCSGTLNYPSSSMCCLNSLSLSESLSKSRLILNLPSSYNFFYSLLVSIQNFSIFLILLISTLNSSHFSLIFGLFNYNIFSKR